MGIFDRKFMQYQLAYGTWYNLHTRFLLLAMILAAIAFFAENLLYLFFIVFLYGYAFFRLYQIFQINDEKFNQKLERQFQYYERQSEKAYGKYDFQLEKIAFAVEMKKIGIKQAIEEIREIIKIYPKIAKGARGILLNIYLVGKEEGTIDEIPKHLIDHLEREWKREDSPNALLDYVRMALKLEKYSLALQILNRTEEETRPYQAMRNPIARSIYKTLQVAIPYYRMIAHGKMENKEQGKKELLKAVKISRSKKLDKEMKTDGEKLGIFL